MANPLDGDEDLDLAALPNDCTLLVGEAPLNAAFGRATGGEAGCREPAWRSRPPRRKAGSAARPDVA